MHQAQEKKLKLRNGLSWAVALVFVWLQVGVVGFAATRRVSHAAPMAGTVAVASNNTVEHANCFCMMCKGTKKKSCCCAPKKGASQPGCVMTERCDGAASPDTLAAGSPLPLTVLPALAARPLPPAPIERARLVFARFARPAVGRAPTPSHAPPQNLS